MKSKSVLFVFLVSLCLAEIIQVYGTDIGYHCQSNLDCQTGNGGRYSRCDSYFSVCVCTQDYLGKKNMAELREDDMKCDHINTTCNKTSGCYTICKPEGIDDQLDKADFCQTVIFCNSKAKCSVGCAPGELWRLDANKDWYGRIQEPVFSDFIPDTNTSVCYDPDRAVNSRPEGMVIKTSDVPGAGLGVFTEKYISRGTVYGPYKGIIVSDRTCDDRDMSWQIDTPSSEILCVDAKNKSLSNWLRYVNMPNDAESENLYAIQHAGEMYYLAFKSIQPGSELLVWYGDDYAENLGIKEHNRPKYTYGKDGYAGGECLKNMCYSDNAICIDDICLCKKGSHARGGYCITDETVGGKCFGKNGDMCLKDENAVCWNEVCFCNDDSSQLNRKCVHDETYGGVCLDWNQDCHLDENAECVDGMCQCKFGTSEVSGKCVADETLGGICDGVNGTRCGRDNNAVCWLGYCSRCIENARNISGTCVLDETAGGVCKGKQGQECLLDSNAVCINGSCLCKKGTQQVGQKCQRDEHLGGLCKGVEGSPCTGDTTTVCSKGVCICNVGSTAMAGKCMKDGLLSGFCKAGKCEGKNVVCNINTKMCVCKTRYLETGGKCVN